MEDWGKSSLFRGEFTIEMENSYLVNRFLGAKAEFSLWRDGSNFTACRIEKVYNQKGKVFPGETATIEFSAINSRLTLTLREGELLFFGVPYTKVGTLKIEQILSVDFKLV